MIPSLSIVIPVYNEAAHLPETIEALVEAVANGGFDADVVLVDDGSTDGSAEVVRAALSERLPHHVVRQPNRGRFEARRTGLEAATGDWVLLLDGRVRLDAEALAFVRPRLAAGERVWTSHVNVEAGGNPFGLFWQLLAELAWAEYFRRPRTVSFGAEDFDRFPKGTTAFLAPRELLQTAVRCFRSKYSDLRFANDDTPVIRWIAERERVHVSPGYSSSYTPRSTLSSFLRHSVHRGIVFLDGHGRRESSLFPAVLAFYPASGLLAILAVRRPATVPLLGVASAATAGAFALAKRRTRFEAAWFGALTPVYALAHGVGMWRGLAILLRERRRHVLEASLDGIRDVGPRHGRHPRLESQPTLEEVDQGLA
jgi:glycosyltransferase involved in cell wall biosynthesis